MRCNRVLQPWERGLEASLDGKRLSANPYPRGTDLFQEWKEGHDHGEESWQEVLDAADAARRPRPDDA